jgi:hypothetical protein
MTPFQPAALLVESFDEPAFILLSFLAPIGEYVDETLGDHTFPVSHLTGMHLIMPGLFS